MIPRLILASRSPRREEILRRLEIPFEVRWADVDEGHAAGEAPDPAQAAAAAAYAKARRVALEAPQGLVLGFDTVVVADGRRLGKPASPEQAREMILALSGRWHEVLTGVAVVDSEKAARLPENAPRVAAGDENFWRADGAAVGVERTRVLFEQISPERAALYVEKGESLDKAGGYGIQEKGSLLVKRIDGCYFNVVGLPVHLLCVLLRLFGVDLLALAGKGQDANRSIV